MMNHIAITRRFARDENGAGYSVSVLLILPIYIVALAFAVELLFMAKAYLVLHAAEEAAVHAVQVWILQRTDLVANGSSLNARVHESVVRSMVPFASMGSLESEPDSALEPMLSATAMNPAAISRFGQNYAGLKELVEVHAEPLSNPHRGFAVTIRYEVPLYFPFFAAIFATHQSDIGAVRVIEASRNIPLSRSQVEAKDLGIPYSVREVKQW